MKVILFSDSHFSENNESEHLEKLIEAVNSSLADVLWIWWDLANSKQWLSIFLKRFSWFRWKKIANLWNRELWALESSTFADGYLDELGEIFDSNGFYLLDNKPVVIDWVWFVGNSWWTDWSLYKWDISEFARKEHIKRFKETYRHWWILPDEFADKCISRVNNHLQEISPICSKILLWVHFIWFEDFLFYGKSEKFDLYNFGMWSKRLWELYFSNPKIVSWFCWHTHRSWVLNKNWINIHNISTDSKQLFLELEI